MRTGEKKLIEQIRRITSSSRREFAGRSARATRVGIGDDCAVLRTPAGHEMLVTTDFSLEGVHFRREWHPAESVGHRCLARGLSDIAAMGGDPVAIFLSLALPQDAIDKWVDGFLHGLTSLARKFSVALAGGDTAQSPGGILADIIVVGSAPTGKAVLRSGARPGDRIYVSGQLGGSAAALDRMLRNPKRRLNPQEYSRHFFPEPRIELGRVLREKGLASAMIDTSDGLSTDLAHICKESGCGAEIEEAAIPLADIGKPEREVDLKFALHGGEDYELLFTAPRNKRIPSQIAGIPITQIGHIARKRRVILMNRDGAGHEFKAQGWEHFRSGKRAKGM